MQPIYIDVFIDPNPNTPEGCGLRFKSESERRAVAQVRYEGEICDVIGWSSEQGGSPCQAWTSIVEDSSAGTAALIYGGDWGLKVTPPGATPIGEPYLLLARDAIVG